MDILVRSWQDLTKILKNPSLKDHAKILPRIARCHGKLLREPCSPKKFIVKCYLGRKYLKGSQQKYTSMQIYIVRYDDFLLARYNI